MFIKKNFKSQGQTQSCKFQQESYKAYDKTISTVTKNSYFCDLSYNKERDPQSPKLFSQSLPKT